MAYRPTENTQGGATTIEERREDAVLAAITDYVRQTAAFSDEAYETTRWDLMDTIESACVEVGGGDLAVIDLVWRVRGSSPPTQSDSLCRPWLQASARHEVLYEMRERAARLAP